MQAVARAGTLGAAAQMALPRILAGGVTGVTSEVLLSYSSSRRSNRCLRRAFYFTHTGLQVSELLLHEVEAAGVDVHLAAMASGGLGGQLGVKVQLGSP